MGKPRPSGRNSGGCGKGSAKEQKLLSRAEFPAQGEKMAEAAEGNPEDRDFRILMDYTHGFMVSQVLFTASDLGLFDALALGPMDAAAVARALGSSPRGTRLLLETCASLGLVQWEDGMGGPTFALTRLSRLFLLAGSPLSQCSMLRYLAGTTVQCWGELGGAVREGRSQYAQAVGVATWEPFKAIYRSHAERLLFMQALQDTWSVYGERVLTAFDLSEFRVICDIGGGSGALATACARLYPTSLVSVFDTPDVVAAARTHFRPPRGAPPIRFLGGDFFRSRLPSADLYILARVLHDWTDADAARLLGRIGRAGGRGTALLLVEAVLTPGGCGPVRTLLLSLTMLLQTQGRERTEAEYQNMAAAAGFTRCFQCRPTGGDLNVMLTRK
ncbi:acetylserotonin O-methyltransferase-like isoform X2 [Arvicola amphibius]|uniref:acetylserotonin O-methyltransferase-like isoform X2 n=1 Tax=Arvicola amphibius TaxID=1047088 RepID=UPI0018E322C2|nr:acetylserotonin O-methyltransferase-like isoform X2 [Arvicola amphibius]